MAWVVTQARGASGQPVVQPDLPDPSQIGQLRSAVIKTLTLADIKDSPKSGRYAVSSLNQSRQSSINFTTPNTGALDANRIDAAYLSAIVASIGNLTVGTSGSLSSGQTAYNTGTGFWLENNAGTPRMSLGSPTQGFTWDGTTFTVQGSMTVTGGTITGGLTISTGGNLHSGQTAWETGTGYWFDYNGGTPRMSIGNGATSGVTWNGSTFRIAGSALVGNLQISSGAGAGVISSGQTAWETGAGYWLEYNSGTPRLSIGNGTTSGITWDGTNFNVYGSVVAGAVAVSTGGNIHSGQTAYNTGTGYWLEYNSGTPRMSVGSSTAGFTWSGAAFSVTGAVTATSGSFTGGVTIGTGGSLSSGQTAWETGAGYWLEYNAGTPRLSIGNGTTSGITWDGTTFRVYGNTLIGALALSTGGNIHAGQTAYNTGTGYWLEYNAGTPRMSIGSSTAGFTWDGATFTVNGTVNITGASTFTAGIAVGTGGNIHSGQTAYNTGTGYWLEYNAGTPRMSLGSSTKGFTWDGTTFTVNGVINALSGNFTGGVTLGNGGAVSSGETAYATGTGFWLGTTAGGVPQFSLQDGKGNFFNISANGTNALALSSSGVSGVLTSKQIDDQGWSQTASWLNITQTPTTLAGYGITNAQTTLPNATAVGQVLQRDNSGAPYFNTKYGPELNVFTAIFGGGTFTAASLVQLGNTFGVPAPAIATTYNAILQFSYSTNAGTPSLLLHFDYSTNSGSTWTTAQPLTLVTSTGGAVGVANVSNIASGTGDFQIRVMCENTSAVDTISVNGRALVYSCTNNNSYSITGAVTSAVPSTATGNCVATYTATTCAASENVTCTPGGGTPPYTFLWSVVSGAGTITAGSTAQTCTVSDTETATTGGATFNTVIKCKVTDSASGNATSSNCTITNTYTLVYPSITATTSVTNGICSASTCGNTCTATGTATANATGGNGSYTYSWSVTSGTGTISSGSTSQTCTVSDTEATTTAPGTRYPTTVQCAVNDSRSTGSVNTSGTVGLKFSCPSN